MCCFYFYSGLTSFSLVLNFHFLCKIISTVLGTQEMSADDTEIQVQRQRNLASSWCTSKLHLVSWSSSSPLPQSDALFPFSIIASHTPSLPGHTREVERSKSSIPKQTQARISTYPSVQFQGPDPVREDVPNNLSSRDRKSLVAPPLLSRAALTPLGGSNSSLRPLEICFGLPFTQG